MDHNLGREGEKEVEHAEDKQRRSRAVEPELRIEREREDADADGEHADSVDDREEFGELLSEIVEIICFFPAVLVTVHLVIGDFF